MTYPNLKNKHLEQAIIRADHSGEGKKKYFGKIPNKCIILYQDPPFNYLKKKFKGKYQKLDVNFSWGFKGIYYTKNFVFCMMSGIGAPHATLMFEELIALGINEFINIGIAGGLRKFGIFLCDKAIRDEGTSQHYILHEKYSYPNKLLTEKLEKVMKKYNVTFERATNWTIDAPLMETKKEVEIYKKEGVATVEMEISALFVVAQLRKVKIAAAFVVSDVLNDDWKDMNQENFVKKDLVKVTECAIDCFSK